MAMSKIEKAGMDANKLKELMSGSSAGSSSGTRGKCGSEDDTDADSLLAGSDTEQDLPDSDEKVLDELENELQVMAGGEGSLCIQSGDSQETAEDSDEDYEHEVDGKAELDDDEEADDHVADDEEEEEEEEYEFDDDEKEIIVLLNDIVDALEEELEGDEEELEGEGEEVRDEEEDEAPIEKDDDAQRKTAQEADLEEARCTELPASAASEIGESDVLILTEKPRIVSDADHTELMDVGKSETVVMPDTARFAQGNGASAAASSHAKLTKKKLRMSWKKKVRAACSLDSACSRPDQWLVCVL